ncbi:site-specific integrase [Paenibacillus sp. HWE-109]|uniref:site-specific integrase n=1 Tax=Paenibacillus sp. HWE-109 TaxID=1306526 RepID=UPI001EDE84C7|nr:site-specific integrase [Paenibacillus sp. HWE-109]UKS29980.1 site-specific integrase [Paenibacillus sp. HWE-109]
MASTLGFKRSEYISDIGFLHFAQASDNIIFDSQDISYYKEAFLEFKSSQRIINCEFEDDEWILSANDVQTAIIFDIDVYSEMKLSLKCFTLLGLIERHDHKYTQFRIKHLVEGILSCQGFRCPVDEVLVHFESWLMSKPRPTLTKLCPAIQQFLCFSNFIFNDELLDIVDQFSSSQRGIRSLPNFKDTLIFDSIIHDFQKKWTLTERLIFFPIVLWWHITLVIPMRVSEFCSIEYDCIIADSSKLFLKIPRKKVRAKKNNEVDIVDVLEINEDLAALILQYKDITSEFKRTSFLLSYDAYCESPRVKQSHGSARKKKRNLETFKPHQLKLLITYFYDEIVESKYGYSGLERANPMDTRHFAFCNMMLQGFNMLSIARIGGHKSLDAQMHYFSHLEQLSQSAVQYLADQHIKFGTINSMNSSLGVNERALRAKSILRSFTEEEMQAFAPMEFGYCTFDPEKCPVGDCRHCPHLYIPESEFNNSVIAWLVDESERLKSIINEQLELMKNLTRNMTYNYSTFEHDPLAQAELSYLATNSSKLRGQKARTDAKLNTIYHERGTHD